jgi:hypothetical protein
VRLTDLFAYTTGLVYHRCTSCFTSRQINAGHILHKGCTCVRCFLPSSPCRLTTIVWSTEVCTNKKAAYSASWVGTTLRNQKRPKRMSKRLSNLLPVPRQRLDDTSKTVGAAITSITAGRTSHIFTIYIVGMC